MKVLKTLLFTVCLDILVSFSLAQGVEGLLEVRYNLFK